MVYKITKIVRALDWPRGVFAGEYFVTSRCFAFRALIRQAQSNDRLTYHNGMATKDRDNDEDSGNCAVSHKGGATKAVITQT